MWWGGGGVWTDNSLVSYGSWRRSGDPLPEPETICVRAERLPKGFAWRPDLGRDFACIVLPAGR
ncbi:MAG: hypothetical protein HY002_21610 [Candidatus Rokubacteria bacterium]|nr:hypothetical protein [Candidatus Rokubacteria bacterium]